MNLPPPNYKSKGFGSLLGDLGLPKLRYTYRKSANERLWEALHAAGRFGRRPWVRRVGTGVLAVALLGGGFAATWALWPRPVPDTALDEIDDILDYMLLSDDFNRLPLEKRLELIKGIIARIKSMDSEDSALMAAFAAGIMGKARAQLQKNVEKLAVDLWDSYASDYQNVAEADRSAYLDRSLIDFTKQMEDISGFKSETKDGDRIGQAKKQAGRDMARMRENQSPMQAQRVGQFVKMIHERGDGLAKPEQRGRMARFSRDMTRHLRDQDINTGKPRGEGAGGQQPPTNPPAPEGEEPGGGG